MGLGSLIWNNGDDKMLMSQQTNKAFLLCSTRTALF